MPCRLARRRTMVVMRALPIKVYAVSATPDSTQVIALGCWGASVDAGVGATHRGGDMPEHAPAGTAKDAKEDAKLRKGGKDEPQRSQRRTQSYAKVTQRREHQYFADLCEPWRPLR